MGTGLLRLGNIDFLVGEEETVRVGPGVSLFAPPFVPHPERALTAYANFYLRVDVSPDTCWPRVCFDDAHQTLNRLCAQIVDEFRAVKPQRSSMLELLTAQLAIVLKRAVRATRVPLPEGTVGKAEILIANNFMRSLRISDIARQRGTSPASLRAYFARFRGCSPRAHLQKVPLASSLCARVKIVPWRRAIEWFIDSIYRFQGTF